MSYGVFLGASESITHTVLCAWLSDPDAERGRRRCRDAFKECSSSDAPPPPCQRQTGPSRAATVAQMLRVSNYFHALLPRSGRRLCLIPFHFFILLFYYYFLKDGSPSLLSLLSTIASIIFSIMELLTVKPLPDDSQRLTF